MRLAKGAELFGETEIDQLDFEIHGVRAFLREKKIFRLEIAMDDRVFVAVVDGRDHLTDEKASLLLGEGLGLDDGVEKFTAGAKFHDQFEFGLCLEDFVQVDDVGVIHGGHSHQFSLEFGLVGHLHGFDDLDGNFGVGLLTIGRNANEFVNRAVSSRPEGCIFVGLALSVLFGEKPFDLKRNFWNFERRKMEVLDMF